MGKDKSFLVWEGKPLLEQIVANFPDVDDLFLSARDASQPLPITARCVYDSRADIGPLAGLVASLRIARNKSLFITTCDAPFVSQSVSDILFEAKDESDDVVVPMTEDGMVHPLIAVYGKSILPRAEAFLDGGKRRMRDLLDILRVKIVESSVFPDGDKCFININTPEDLMAAKGAKAYDTTNCGCRLWFQE